ncbi:MAG: hypothetical protein CM15mP74_14990 [Halieaceae bacterium]|nr:MAG: hypothetical protein CM15mP74_14990 [Halieaceae bacterium]
MSERTLDLISTMMSDGWISGSPTRRARSSMSQSRGAVDETSSRGQNVRRLFDFRLERYQ